MLSFILGHTDTIHWWNIADFIVAIAFVYILVWGRSNKLLKKNEFNEDFLSLDTMKSLRGFAALGVILHHISQQQTFQQEIQQKQNELMAPIYEKAQNTIKELAKGQALTAVFDASSALYFDEATTVDLTPAARKALNIAEGRTLQSLQEEIQAQAASQQQ